MSETEHTADHQDGIRRALAMLEQALARHEPHASGIVTRDVAGQAFLRSLEMMRGEALRLRMLLED